MDKCDPRNDIDCYFNLNWKKNQKYPISQFTIFQTDFNNSFDAWIRAQDDDNYLKIFYFSRPKSLKVLNPLLEEIDRSQNLSDILALLTIYDIPHFFSIVVKPQTKFTNERKYSISIGEPSISLAKDDYDTINLKKLREILAELNLNDNISILETLFSFSILSPIDSINPKIIENELTFEEFINFSEIPSFWNKFFKKLGISPQFINITNPNCFRIIEHSMLNFTIKTQKDYLKWNVYQDLGFYTNFFVRLLYLDPMRSNSTKWINLISEVYPNEINQWIRNNSNRFIIENTKIMSKQLLETLNEYWIQTDKIDDEVKIRFIEKTKKIRIIIGCDDYRIKSINNCNTWLETILQNRKLWNEVQYQKVNKKIDYDPTNFIVNQIMFNSYYDQYHNVVLIPYSLMNELIFSHDISSNFGGLGAIIGHEIMHAFDMYGCMYDQDGRLDPIQIPIIKIEAKNIEKVYDSISTITENTADVTGLKLSFRTMKKFYADLNEINFFKQWAYLFRNKISKFAKEEIAKIDVHSDGSPRINNTIKFLNDYYRIFNVKPSDKMYIPPDERLTLLD